MNTGRLTTRLAWKNIWRNQTRSFIFMAAALLGIALAILALNLMKSISTQRLEDAISIQTGHLQIHRMGFTDDHDPGLFIQNEKEINGLLYANRAAINYSKRQVVNAMAASAENALICLVKGVQPDQEKKVSALENYLIEGSWFNEDISNPVLVSSEIAGRLNLSLHAKLIITIKNSKGELEGGAFRIAGIFKTPNTAFDEGNVLVDYNDLATLTGLREPHEYAIHLNDSEQLPGFEAKLDAALQGDIEVKSWKQLLPELFAFSGFTDLVSVLFTIIILLGLGFGLLNTMNMIVQERTREIGMLRAIGQGQGAVFQMLFKESGLMMGLGGLCGIALGVTLVAITSQTGIRLGDGFGSLGIRSVIYPAIFPGQLAMLLVLTLIMTLVISALPASRAYRIDPSKALKEY